MIFRRFIVPLCFLFEHDRPAQISRLMSRGKAGIRVALTNVALRIVTTS